MTYLRYSLLGMTNFFVLLSFTYFLLYFLGDLTENVDIWLGEGTAITAVLGFALSSSEIYLRISPFLLVIASVLYWVRSAQRGELTAVEAAGSSPFVHWISSFVLLTVVAAGVLWYSSVGKGQISALRTQLQVASSGRLSSVSSGRIRVLDNDTVILSGKSLRPLGHVKGSISSPRIICDHRLDGMATNFASNRVESCAPITADATESIVADVVDRDTFIPWLLFLSPALLFAGFGRIQRHGRSSGMAVQAFLALGVVVGGWIAIEASASLLVPPQQYYALTVVLMALLTINQVWRTISTKVGGS